MTKKSSRRSLATSDASALGGRKATINDIARLANVSKKTVSRVINQSPFVKDETRAKVSSMIERFGYSPDPQARGLAFRKSFLVGLIYDDPNAHYIVDIQDGALEVLRGQGFELVVHPCDRRSEDFIPGVRRFVERQKLYGVIVLPSLSEDENLTRALIDIGCDRAPIASTNDHEAAAEVARYLGSLGHERIGFIAGPEAHRSARERRDGFLGALAQLRHEVSPELIVQGDYSFESGVVCGEALLTRDPRPTAIFASNDEMAAGVYRAAHRLGLSIPADVSVIGFDDSPLASRLCPPLTTVRLPIREMGRLAAATLLGDTATSPVVAPRLIVRDSC